jgi:hypothetical protein
MSVDETLMCSFQVHSISRLCVSMNFFSMCLSVQILKPSEKKTKYQYGGLNSGRPVTPPRAQQQPPKNKKK